MGLASARRAKGMDKKAESLFFENPATDRSPPGDFGLLYLLRRDINQCMEHEILWPGAMAILAGTDLLGKFMAGEDEKAVGLRFRSFIMRYFDSATHDDAEVIYQLRNSLLHSFGLYAKSKTSEYRFQLVFDKGNALIHRTSPTNFRIDLARLHNSFEVSVEKYRQDLLTDVALQGKFMAMFPNYGKISIEGEPDNAVTRGNP
jgi:hypothetical protein